MRLLPATFEGVVIDAGAAVEMFGLIVAMSPTLENGAGMMGVFTNLTFVLETACPSMTQTSL